MSLKKKPEASGTLYSKDMSYPDDEKSRLALKQDAVYEEMLLSLLSKNEHILIQLEDSKVKKNPIKALEYLSELANEIAQFSNLKFKINVTYLRDLLVMESNKNPNVKLLHLTHNRLSVETLVNLFKGWASHPSDRQPIFDEICVSMLNIIQSYFVLFESSFRSDLMKKQWSETYKIHTDELRTILSKVKF